MLNPSVSIIIPAYNCAKTIAETLRAVSSQDYQGEIEVVVVDDGSQDNTGELIKGFIGIKYYYQANAGPAAARNFGVSKSKGEVLVFTDSDCIPHGDWIKRLIEGFTLGDVGAVAGSYGIANPQKRLARGIHAEIMYRHCNLMPEFPRAFGSYNVAIKKQLFQKVGGFDTEFRTASGEDNDLSYKILKEGFCIRFERLALVDHHHPVKVKRYWFEQFRHGVWRASLYRRHPEKIKGDDYTFWKDIIEVPLSIFSSVLMLGGGLDTSFFYIGVFFLIILFSINVVYGIKMMSFNLDSIYYTFVMFVRSYCRSFGFVFGWIKLISKLN